MGLAWELGDLADEVETTYNGGQLQNFACEVGVEHSTLKNYRQVSRAFVRMRTKGSWTVYAGREDRYDILAECEHWTVNAPRWCASCAGGGAVFAVLPLHKSA